MKQTRLESLLEKVADLSSGFLIAWATYEFVVLPNWDILSSFEVTFMFTMISLARGYMWRRFFANELHTVVHSAISKFIRLTGW